MKTVSFIALVLGFVFSSFGQKLTIQQTPPNSFNAKSNDIFDLSIINTTGFDISVHVIGTWYFNNQKVVTLEANNVLFKNGISQLSSDEFAAIKKIYFDHYLESSELNTGSLPPGIYKACISVKCATSNCSGAGENAINNELSLCIDLNILNPNPFLLSTPSNGSELNEYRPTFTWLPYAQPLLNQEISYSMVLVKRNNPKQSCNDAIMRNRPLLKEDDISHPMLLFPGDFNDLDTGDYAWRVQATLNDQILATSESWCFSIRPKVKLIDSNVYVKLSTTDFYIHHFKGDMYFIYNEIYSSETLSVKLYNQEGKEIPVNKEFSTLYGENKFILETSDLGLLKNSLYYFKVKDQAGKTYTLKFKIL